MDDHADRHPSRRPRPRGLDAEVHEGRAANRSEDVRHGISRLQRDQRYRSEEATLVDLARRGEPVYPDLDGMLDLPQPTLD